MEKYRYEPTEILVEGPCVLSRIVIIPDKHSEKNLKISLGIQKHSIPVGPYSFTSYQIVIPKDGSTFMELDIMLGEGDALFAITDPEDMYVVHAFEGKKSIRTFDKKIHSPTLPTKQDLLDLGELIA